MRPTYKSGDESTSNKSSSNESSNNKSTRKDDCEVGDKDDIKFGMINYRNDSIHKIAAGDKQEEEEIVEYYLEDDELDTNTKTRVNNKKKNDTIYTRSNPYIPFIEWTN